MDNDYAPSPETQHILDRTMAYINSVNYSVTARWCFYRLLQDGTLNKKADYKKLLSLLSKARKRFWGDWRPDTLADDTRGALLTLRSGFYTYHFRGHGFKSEKVWLETLKKQLNYHSDRWIDQPAYVEIWFEAAAMQSQFQFYANENIPLFAFHGDVSIPAKWEGAKRLFERWNQLRVPTYVLYFGDLDKKGQQIPESANNDVQDFVTHVDHEMQNAKNKLVEHGYAKGIYARQFLKDFHFIRVGINQAHVRQFNIPENPERLGTYQWEGLSDEGAQALIRRANDYIDLDRFAITKLKDDEITARFQRHIENFMG